MKRGDRVQGSGFGLVAGLALALAGCATPRPQFTDADWVSHSTTGRGCYERGDYRRGADAYQRAARRAWALDDADALAVSAVNRAVCLLAEGQADAALAGVDEALRDSRVSPGRRMELLVAGARAELALARLDPARARAGEALDLRPPPALQAQALLIQSAAQLAGGDAAAAARILADGRSAGSWAKLPAAIRAEYAARRADIAMAAQKPGEAAALLDEAAAWWKQANRLPEMARALAEAGRQAQAAGDLPGACDRLYRAARSLWGQRFQPEAVRALETGVACAEQLKDEARGRQMAELVVTFQNDGRLSK